MKSVQKVKASLKQTRCSAQGGKLKAIREGKRRNWLCQCVDKADVDGFQNNKLSFRNGEKHRNVGVPINYTTQPLYLVSIWNDDGTDKAEPPAFTDLVESNGQRVQAAKFVTKGKLTKDGMWWMNRVCVGRIEVNSVPQRKRGPDNCEPPFTNKVQDMSWMRRL